MASQNNADLPVSSAAIVMVSPPMTQDGAQDVFHTPPEESSLPSSGNQQPTVTVDIGVVYCSVNKAIDSVPWSSRFADSGGFPDESEFVDLGEDSELGFSEGDEEQVAGELWPGFGGDGAGKVPEIRSDQIGVSDADAEKPCNFEVEDPQPRETVLDGVQMVEDEICREISDGKDLSSGMKSGTLAADLGTNPSSEDDATEDSGKQDRSDKEPVLKRAADELKSGREKKDKLSGYDDLFKAIAAGKLKSGQEKNKFSSYDVLLKAMAEENAHKNKDEPDLLEMVKRKGITFPRPRWWPKNDDRFASGMFLFEEAP